MKIFVLLNYETFFMYKSFSRYYESFSLSKYNICKDKGNPDLNYRVNILLEF